MGNLVLFRFIRKGSSCTPFCTAYTLYALHCVLCSYIAAANLVPGQLECISSSQIFSV